MGGASFRSGGVAPASALSRGTSTSTNDMGTPLWLFFAMVVCSINGSDNASGAQTERRGGAGPVGGLLGGKDPTGRLVQILVNPSCCQSS